MISLMIDLERLPFRETRWPGVSVHFCESDRESGFAAVWIRMEPGCSYPAHRHQGDEDVLVVEGAFEDENGHYEEGRFVRFASGSRHHPRCPDAGPRCTLFAIAREGIELFDES